MLSAANEADYLRTPACCRCCAETKARCVCQICHDGYVLSSSSLNRPNNYWFMPLVARGRYSYLLAGLKGVGEGSGKISMN